MKKSLRLEERRKTESYKNTVLKMEELIIYKFQAKEIEDALRMVSNALNCETKETCLDRTVCRAKEMIKEVLNKSTTKK